MRYVTFQFTIPFDGGAADTAERMIRERITHTLLNSLSLIHPDIRARVSNLPIEKVAPAPAKRPT